MDFTLRKFEKLLRSLKKGGYVFFIFKDYIINYCKSNLKLVVLRHDVDRTPENSLKMARLEYELGIKGTYYFRSLECSFNPEIMKKIENMGHEVGFHYETVNKVEKFVSKDLSILSDKAYENNNAEFYIRNMLIDEGYKLFVEELEKFRRIVDVKTICMHGSPRNKFDNKLIWEKYDYKKLGIVGEPYLDINWKQVGYLTDTGRRWNGNYVNIRDRVNSNVNLKFKGTDDLIQNVDKLPSQVMITIHPQRWTNNPTLWVRELIWQNFKNIFKFFKLKSQLGNYFKNPFS